MAAELQSSGNDGSIPIFDLEALLQGKGLKDRILRGHGARKAEEELCGGGDDLRGLAEPGFVQASVNEFLDDLDRQREVPLRDETGSGGSFRSVIRGMGDGIDEDVGIIENAHGFIFPSRHGGRKPRHG